MRNTILILAIIISTLSCKKKDSPTPVIETVNPTIDTNSYYGVLTSSSNNIYFGATLYSSSGDNSALFKSTPITDDFYHNQLVYGGTVSLNDTNFRVVNPSSSYVWYDDSTRAIFGPTLKWQVSGGNDVPAINYTYTESSPSFTGMNTMIGDTLNLNQSMSISGVTGANEITILIQNDDTNEYLYKTIPSNSTTVTLSQNDLSKFANTGSANSGTVWVMCFKSHYKTFNGKKVKFKVGFTVMKTCILKK